MLTSLLMLCVVGVVLGSGPCAPNEDLIQFLTAIHMTPSYSKLTGDEKALLSELVAEAGACQLTYYIALTGFDKVLALLSHLNQMEAQFMSNYLQQHLALERQLAAIYGTTTQKPHTTS